MKNKILSKWIVAFLCMALSFSILNSDMVVKADTESNVPVIEMTGLLMVSPADAELEFSSGGSSRTHQFIVRSAISILGKDKGSSKLNSKLSTIAEYADWPDVLGNETDYATFAGHFYDPDTGKNWMGSTSKTAKNRAVDYYNKAVDEYKKGNYEEAFRNIGKGSHYVGDLNEPHHASNLTAINSNHSDFEKYVDSHLSSYTISNNSFSQSVYNEALNQNVSSFLHNGAKYAKSLVPKAKQKSTYDEAGKACVQHAIQNEAQYLYKFAKAVGIY